MITETLYSLPLRLPTGKVPSQPVTILDVPRSVIPIGSGCRRDNFGIEIPRPVQDFRDVSGAQFVLHILSTEPEGEGQPVECWIRQT